MLFEHDKIQPVCIEQCWIDFVKKNISKALLDVIKEMCKVHFVNLEYITHRIPLAHLGIKRIPSLATT